MTMNKICKWKRFQKVGKSQPKGLHKEVPSMQNMLEK
jgi:hypothetical protein